MTQPTDKDGTVSQLLQQLMKRPHDRRDALRRMSAGALSVSPLGLVGCGGGDGAASSNIGGEVVSAPPESAPPESAPPAGTPPAEAAPPTIDPVSPAPPPIEPAPSAEIERIASEAVVMPARERDSADSTVTGEGVSV